MADASQALTQSAAAGGESSRLFIAQARLDELEQRGDGAAQLLDGAVAVGVSGQDRAEALIARASFNVRAQRLREAGDDLRQAGLSRSRASSLIERFPTEPRAFLAAAIFASTTGDAALAEQRLRDAIQLDTAFLPARLALASVLATSNRSVEAVQQLAQALEAEPNDASVLMGLARLSIARGDVSNADSLLTRAVTAAPTAAQARFALGEVKVRLGQLDSALKLAEALSRDLPGGPEGALLVGQVRLAQGRHSAAAASFETAFRRAATWPVLARYARSLHLGGQTSEAVRRLRTWLAEDPEFTEARITLAELLQAEGRQAEAVVEYGKVLEAASVQVTVLNNAAWLLQEEDPPRALALAEKAAVLAPDHPAVLDTLGLLLVEAGRAE